MPQFILHYDQFLLQVHVIKFDFSFELSEKAVFQLYSKFMSSLLALRSHELKEYLMGLLFSKKSNRTSIFKWLPSSVFALLSCRRPYQVSTTVLSDCWATFVMYFLSFFLFFWASELHIRNLLNSGFR